MLDRKTPVDPVALTQALVRCPSVTPDTGEALDVLAELLADAGFACTRVDRGGVANLFARWGDKAHARTFGFNGHTDVVPIGAEADWSFPPFGAEIDGDWIYGRGTTDMKSGVAAFAAAAADFVRDAAPEGAVILAITGDEEGDATDGTVALLDWMAVEGEAMSVCLVGEPTSPEAIGDAMKIGRRGSMNARIAATGVQGHSAYPERAKNPVPALARLVDRLASHALDRGTDHFDPSTLAVTTFDVGNAATNVIPAEAHAGLNIRFNDTHTSASLIAWMETLMQEVTEETGIAFSMTHRVSGEAFLTPPGALSDLVGAAVADVTGRTPVLSTSGGTSDARFVKSHCPVVEFGLTGKRMHAVDERVSVAEIRTLKAVYTEILRRYFA